MKKNNHEHDYRTIFKQIKICRIQCDYDNNRSLFENNDIFFNKIHHENKQNV